MTDRHGTTSCWQLATNQWENWSRGVRAVSVVWTWRTRDAAYRRAAAAAAVARVGSDSGGWWWKWWRWSHAGAQSNTVCRWLTAAVTSSRTSWCCISSYWSHPCSLVRHSNPLCYSFLTSSFRKKNLRCAKRGRSGTVKLGSFPVHIFHLIQIFL